MASNEMNSISKRSTYQPEQTKENIVSQQIANNKIQNIIIINYELNSPRQWDRPSDPKIHRPADPSDAIL